MDHNLNYGSLSKVFDADEFVMDQIMSIEAPKVQEKKHDSDVIEE